MVKCLSSKEEKSVQFRLAAKDFGAVVCPSTKYTFVAYLSTSAMARCASVGNVYLNFLWKSVYIIIF